MNPDSLAETRQAPVEKTDPTGAFYLRAYPDGELLATSTEPRCRLPSKPMKDFKFLERIFHAVVTAWNQLQFPRHGPYRARGRQLQIRSERNLGQLSCSELAQQSSFDFKASFRKEAGLPSLTASAKVGKTMGGRYHVVHHSKFRG
jgi:hypothetical protein